LEIYWKWNNNLRGYIYFFLLFYYVLLFIFILLSSLSSVFVSISLSIFPSFEANPQRKVDCPAFPKEKCNSSSLFVLSSRCLSFLFLRWGFLGFFSWWVGFVLRGISYHGVDSRNLISWCRFWKSRARISCSSLLNWDFLFLNQVEYFEVWVGQGVLFVELRFFFCGSFQTTKKSEELSAGSCL
jgi:hypothetical protein